MNPIYRTLRHLVRFHSFLRHSSTGDHTKANVEGFMQVERRSRQEFSYLTGGRTWDTSEEVAAESASGKFKSYRLSDGQALVVGICNRQAQCWQEPQFLAAAKPAAEHKHCHGPDSEENPENQLPDDPDEDE